MRRQVERGHAPVALETRIGEHVVVLASVGARGVQKQQLAARARLLGEQLRLAGRERHLHVAAGDGREVGGRPVGRSVGGRPGQLEQPRDDVGVLGERLAAALDVELRHLREQREHRLVARGRDGRPELGPHLGRGLEAEVDPTVERLVGGVLERLALAQVDPGEVVAAAQRERDVGAARERAQPPVVHGTLHPVPEEAVPVGLDCHSAVIARAFHCRTDAGSVLVTPRNIGSGGPEGR